MKVSIIIPNYNNSARISTCIDSCLSQKEWVKEIIIVDDNSTDNSIEVILEYSKKYPDLIKFFINNEKGANSARNLGFQNSTGLFIQWLDSDDVILPEKFSQQVKVLEDNKNADIAFSDWILDTYDINGILIKREIAYNKQYEDFLFELISDNWSPIHNYLLTRKFALKLNELKAWNPKTNVFQDREYITLAAIEGAKFIYVRGLFSIYNRWSKFSVSNNHSEKGIYYNIMINKFINLINNQNIIPTNKKNNYIKYLLFGKIQHSITTKKFILRDKRINLKNIDFAIAPNFKSKIKILIALIQNYF